MNDYFKGGYIQFVESAHHDLGFHKGTYQLEYEAQVNEIEYVLELMKSNSQITWVIEFSRFLYDYVDEHPEKINEITQRIQEGRLEIGALYSSPYTSFISNELLVRQLYYGKKWAEKTFRGLKANIFYNTDVPALSMQMPQILKKAGVDCMYLGRCWNFNGFDKNEFAEWEAPDGSKVNAYAMHIYVDSLFFFNDNKERFFQEWLGQFAKSYPKLGYAPFPIMFFSTDSKFPDGYIQEIQEYNQYAKENNLLPIKRVTLNTAVNTIFDNTPKDNLLKLQGEWSNKWFYENGASDYHTFQKQKNAARYLSAAESFYVFNCLLDKNFSDYPAHAFECAYRKASHACHTYASHNTIPTFKKNYKEAFDEGKCLLQDSIQKLAGKVKLDGGKTAIVIFNSLSFDRKEITEIDLKTEDLLIKNPVISDEYGNRIPSQLTKNGKLQFVAHVPSCGYSTYHIDQGEDTLSQKLSGLWENDFYKIKPIIGGLESIYDKELGKELFDTSKFLIGEWLNFTYNGLGAGEHLYIWQPEKDSAISIKQYSPSPWRCTEHGDVYTAFEFVANTDRGVVVVQVKLYNELKRIDFNICMPLTDAKEKQQIRIAFPMNTGDMTTPDSSVDIIYQSSFGHVHIGKDEANSEYALFNENIADSSDCNDARNAAIRPREVQDYIYCGDDSFGVMFSSYDLGWDYQDATRNPVRNPVLQPVLYSASKSCHWDDGYWTQEGFNTFEFSIFSGEKGVLINANKAVSRSTPLFPVVIKNGTNGNLPCSNSFFKTDADNITISSIKKQKTVMQLLFDYMKSMESRAM